MVGNEESNLGERMEQLERSMETRLGSIEDKLDALIITVRGSSNYGSRGIAPRVDDLERRVIALEALVNQAKWTAAGFGLAAGVLGFGIGELVARLFGG